MYKVSVNAPFAGNLLLSNTNTGNLNIVTFAVTIDSSIVALIVVISFVVVAIMIFFQK